MSHDPGVRAGTMQPGTRLLIDPVYQFTRPPDTALGLESDAPREASIGQGQAASMAMCHSVLVGTAEKHFPKELSMALPPFRYRTILLGPQSCQSLRVVVFDDQLGGL